MVRRLDGALPRYANVEQELVMEMATKVIGHNPVWFFFVVYYKKRVPKNFY